VRSFLTFVLFEMQDADKVRKQAHQKVDEVARTAHKEAAAEL
jgi:hypothetical protein